jgi:hypothetical protein
MSTKSLLLQSAAVFLLSSGLAFAQSPGLGNEDDPDLPRPGFVTNADEGVSQEIQAEMLQDGNTAVDDAAMANALADWKLADYQGATITSELGETIGTVEKVTTDSGQNVYLVVTPSGADTAVTGSRLVPLHSVSYNAQSGGLLLDTRTSSFDTMSPYDDTTASQYTDVTDDEDFRDAFNFDLEGSSEVNSNVGNSAQ